MPLTRLNTSFEASENIENQKHLGKNNVFNHIVEYINNNEPFNVAYTDNSKNQREKENHGDYNNLEPFSVTYVNDLGNMNDSGNKLYEPPTIISTQQRSLSDNVNMVDLYFSVVDRRATNDNFLDKSHQGKSPPGKSPPGRSPPGRTFQMTRVYHIQTPKETVESFNKDTITKLLLHVIGRATFSPDYKSVPVVPNFVTGVRLDQWEDALLQDIVSASTSSFSSSAQTLKSRLTFHNGTKCPLIHLFNNSDFLENISTKYNISKKNPLLIILTNDLFFEKVEQRAGVLMLPNLRTIPQCPHALASLRSIHRVKTPTSAAYMNISSNISRSGTPTKREYTTIKKFEDEAVASSNYMSMFPEITVLIVEDNIINRSILSGVLRKHKIKYKLAKNGKEAVDTWCKGGIHLIFMDLQLPVMTGIEAARKIRHLEKINGITRNTEQEGFPSKSSGASNTDETSNANASPQDEQEWTLEREKFKSPVIIVALTASNNQQDKENALTSGCNDYLTKPVNLVWLSNKLGEWGCMQALIATHEQT